MLYYQKNFKKKFIFSVIIIIPILLLSSDSSSALVISSRSGFVHYQDRISDLPQEIFNLLLTHVVSASLYNHKSFITKSNLLDCRDQLKNLKLISKKFNRLLIDYTAFCLPYTFPVQKISTQISYFDKLSLGSSLALAQFLHDKEYFYIHKKFLYFIQWRCFKEVILERFKNLPKTKIFSNVGSFILDYYDQQFKNKLLLNTQNTPFDRTFFWSSPPNGINPLTLSTTITNNIFKEDMISDDYLKNTLTLIDEHLKLVEHSKRLKNFLKTSKKFYSWTYPSLIQLLYDIKKLTRLTHINNAARVQCYFFIRILILFYYSNKRINSVCRFLQMVSKENWSRKIIAEIIF